MRRNYGETVNNLVDAFPYWFNGNFEKYRDHADRLPVDAHELIALIAPRPVYITGAEDDRWGDPKGEFLAGVAAGPVYRLLGAQDLGTDEMPKLNHPIMRRHRLPRAHRQACGDTHLIGTSSSLSPTCTFARVAEEAPTLLASFALYFATTFNVVSIRSCEFPPTMILKEPGSTTLCMSRLRNDSSSKPRDNSTVLVSPGASAIRRKPRNSFTGRVTELTSSRM